jgi:hypothetical protein
MSNDIEKLAVFDDRIVQSRPRYAVEKGALSVTNSPFNAIAANTSQHTYNILVPSENVFIDRSVDWTSTCFCSVDVVVPTAFTPATVQPILEVGVNCALAPFPLQTLTTTMTATINDTTVTINSADVLPQVLRMTDYKKNRLIRTCPTMLDKAQAYAPWVGGVNSVLNDYGTALNVDEVANGAFPGFAWTQANGNPAPGPNAQAVVVTPQGLTSWSLGGAYPQPSWLPGVAVVPGTYTIYFSFNSTEKLVLSPFVFSDIHEWDTGLFGCQNIQLVMNLSAPSRVLRCAAPAYAIAGGNLVSQSVVGNIQYNIGASAVAQQAFSNSRVNLQFLTPSLDIPLPPKSVVPYMEFPRYISNGLNSIPAGASAQVSSQTITLPQIPDLIIIYAKPVGGYNIPANAGTFPGQADVGQADWMFPISNISVNFDNFAGLLSAHTQQQLYKMSVHNGLEQDWPSWSGQAWNKGVLSPTVGGMLVLKPGRDIVLQAGQAPSLVGNFVLQFNVTLNNYSAGALQPQLYVITANSGFFETIKGSSRVVKGVLTEQDIISAPVAPGGTHGSLRRAVGGNIFGSLGNALSRVKGMFSHAPAVAKEALSAMKVPGASGVSRKVGNAMTANLMDRLA